MDHDTCPRSPPANCDMSSSVIRGPCQNNKHNSDQVSILSVLNARSKKPFPMNTLAKLTPPFSAYAAGQTHNDPIMDEYFANLPSRTNGRLALRVLYDAFYGKCGYIPPWARQPQPNDLSPSTLTRPEQKSNTPSQYFTKVAAVEAHKTELKNFTEADFEYIIGSRCKFKGAEQDESELELRALAIYLERLMEHKEEAMRTVILKMFQWVTGYNTFKDAYMNENENRIVSRLGLSEE